MFLCSLCLCSNPEKGMGVWKRAHAFSATSAVIICDITFPANLALTFTLPKLLNVYKPLSDVSYGYCSKCSAVNYQPQCTGKICQEMIQK